MDQISGKYADAIRSFYLFCLFCVFQLLPVHEIHAQKIDSLIKVARKLILTQPQEAANLLQPELEMAIDNRRYKDVTLILHQLAMIELMKGSQIGKDSLDRLALHYAQLTKDTFLIANSYTKYATDLHDGGKSDSAVNACLIAIQLYKAKSLEEHSWACHIALGQIAFDAERFTEAEEHYLDAWEVICKVKSIRDQFIVASVLQSFYFSTGQHEKYASILEQLLQSNPYFVSRLNENNAHYYSLVRIFDTDKESVEDLKKNIELHRRMHQPYGQMMAMIQLGDFLSGNGRYEEALDTLHHALAMNVDSKPLRMRVYYKMYENRRASGKFEEAFNYFEKFNALRDTVNSEESNAHIRELETQYETKEKEVALLKEQDLSRQRTMQRNILLGSLGVIVWFSLFGILFFWNKARLQKQIAFQTQTLNQQKIQQLEQENKLMAMSSMIGGQEAERKRIARDLHDGLGGLLSSVKAQINLIQHQVDQLSNGEMYTKANTLIDTASAELRRIAYNMMPSSLSKLGLKAALEDLGASLQAHDNLHVDVQLLGMNERLPETVEIMIYRIIQELCHNVIKHAHASEVLIQLNQVDHELFLIVEDNGIGIDESTLQSANGIGMKSVESRVRFLNGKMDISSEAGKGTCVSINLPLEERG